MPRALILILWLTVAASLPLLRAGFVYEDVRILANPNLVDLSMQPWEREWLSMLSYRVNDVLDPSHQALGFHLGNLAIHLVNGVLIWIVASRLLSGIGALAVAGVFLVHPLSMSAVAYIAARNDLLSTTGLLLGLCCLIRPSGQPLSWLRVIGLVLASVGAVMAKESAVCAVLLWPWTELCVQPRRLSWAWCADRTRLGVVLLLLLLPTVALATYLWHEPYAWSGTSTPVTYGGLQLIATWRYLALVVWPVGFSIDHDLALTPPILVGLVAAMSLVCVLSVWRLRRTAPLLAWACGWVVLCLAPRFVVRLPEYLNEHQMYPALVGVAILGGIAWQAWTRPAESDLSLGAGDECIGGLRG